MPLDALGLALGAAALHALWNLLLARERDTEGATAVALVVPPAMFSMPASICSTTESVRASAFPKFSITPSTVVRITSKSAGNSDATSAESLSLSPNLISVNDTASFSLMIGTTPRPSNVTSVLRALRCRS